ncbi:MAG: LPP20 family lipoprotein [Epsilonproteobacteria bacterium]|nr:LPP20 family lipoprotein [Campylobacterota bacterium]
MRYLIQIATIFVLLLTFVGCGGAKPAPAKVKTPPPGWVYGVSPADTQEKMYGLGIGKNREAAIKAALNDMVSKLSVTLQSSFKSKEKVENYYQTSTVTSNIEADIAKIKINNYKVIRSYKVNYKEFAVMIETDKQQFIRGLKDDLEQKYKNILQQLEHVNTENIIVRYNTKKVLSKEAEKLKSLIFIISELDPQFNKNKYLEFISNMRSVFLQEAQNLKFYVDGDTNSKLFTEKIKNNLVKNHFNLVSARKNAIRISVKTEKRLSDSFVKIITFTIHVSVYEGKNRIGGKVTVIKERYTDKRHAYETAAIHFNQIIEKNGIKAILGIALNTDNN